MGEAPQSQPAPKTVETISMGEKRSAPGISNVQSDVGLANQYRLETIKYVLSMAGALLAFTISFKPERGKLDILPELVQVGWATLSLSLIAGLLHLVAWERFYITYRDYDHKLGTMGAGKPRRKCINKWRKACMVTQYLGFAIGMPAIALYAILNF